MIISAVASIVLSCAPAQLKLDAIRYLNLESFSEALEAAKELKLYQDPESIYLTSSAFASAGHLDESLLHIETHKDVLKDSGYYRKSLETLSLNVFRHHFNSSQEPLKMASLASLAQEPDYRVLNELISALEHPSVKIKVLALRGLSNFPDEKVRLLLLDKVKVTQHPAVTSFIAQLFAHWKDKRIVPLLHQKIKEDTVNLEEKIGYMVSLRDLQQEFNLDEIKKYAKSPQAAIRLLACYLMTSPKCLVDEDIVLALLNDHHMWVKQSAVQLAIKKKIFSNKIKDKINAFFFEKSFDLKKIYYHYGLVNGDKDCQTRFIEEFKEAQHSIKRQLASIIYSSGPFHDPLVQTMLSFSLDPHTRLTLGLYLLSSENPKQAIELMCASLKELEGKKIFALSEPVTPFFTIEDENNSQLSMTAGQRRVKDKYFRLQLFHLLALKKMPEAKQVLIQLLKTDLFELSLDAMLHFWEHFGYENRDFLKELISENDPELRLKATLILSYLDYDKTARKALMQVFYKQTYQMQIQILFALSKYHEEDVIDFYFKQLKSKYPLIQAISAGCLFSSLFK